jgi:hypothetical protein
LETELNFDLDPNLQIISDAAGFGSASTTLRILFASIFLFHLVSSPFRSPSFLVRQGRKKITVEQLSNHFYIHFYIYKNAAAGADYSEKCKKSTSCGFRELASCMYYHFSIG